MKENRGPNQPINKLTNRPFAGARRLALTGPPEKLAKPANCPKGPTGAARYPR